MDGRSTSTARRVDQDHRERRRRQPLAVAGAQAAGRDDQAVDPPLDEQVEVAGLPLGIVGGVAQQDRVALGPGGVLDGTDELREVRVLDVGDDQPERLGRPSLERAGDARRAVVEVAGGGQDPVARLGASVAQPRQDPADRRRRDPGSTGDVGDGRDHRRLRSACLRRRSSPSPGRSRSGRPGRPPRAPRVAPASPGRPAAPRARLRRPSSRGAARR